MSGSDSDPDPDNDLLQPKTCSECNAEFIGSECDACREADEAAKDAERKKREDEVNDNIKKAAKDIEDRKNEENKT